MIHDDSYKIVISISHHRIAFEYWQRDGEKRLVPISNAPWPAPLAFYCSPMGIEIGEVALRAVNAGTNNAFDRYFVRLASDETYLLGGRRQPIRYLLLEAAESIFKDFFKNDLYGNKGSLADNRASMPITMVCEADVQPKERALLADLFKSSGYNRFKITEYDSFIERYVKDNLAGQYPCSKVLVAWTEGSDLTLTLFDLHQSSERCRTTLPGLGVDPRLEHIKQTIWQRIKGQNPWLVYESEEETIAGAALEFLSSDIPLLNDTIMLSDGNSYHYSLNRTIINNLQCDEGAEIKAKLDAFLKDNGVSDKADTLLILRGMASGNVFFEQTLCPGFREIIRSDRKLRENVMQLLIADSNPTIEVKQPENRKPIPSTSNGSGRDSSGSNTTGDDHPTNNDKNPSENTSGPILDPKKLQKLKREWREVKAVAKGKISIGKIDEARSIINEFLKNCRLENDTDIASEVTAYLETIPKSSGRKPESPVRNQQRSEPKQSAKTKLTTADLQSASERKLKPTPKTETKSAPTKPSIPATPGGGSKNSSKRTSPPPVDQGLLLISAGKLKEARDLYRNQGDSDKARLVSDVIRSMRSADMRIMESEIEKYKKAPDKSAISRIVQELEEFVNSCDRIRYEATKYKKALQIYRKLNK